MSKLQIKIESAERMISFGTLLTKHMYPNLVIAMTGDLGAGKTTFTKGIGIALGIKRVINSPTFTIMKIYDAQNKVNGIEKLYHLDVYRITDSSTDFELAEYFEMNGVSIIEWADIISDLLPDNHWHITIKDLGNDQRSFTIEAPAEVIERIKTDCEADHYEFIN